MKVLLLIFLSMILGTEAFAELKRAPAFENECDNAEETLKDIKILQTFCIPQVNLWTVGKDSILVQEKDGLETKFKAQHGACNDAENARLQDKTVTLKLKCVQDEATVKSVQSAF